MLNNVNNISAKQMILSGDLNLYFISLLKSSDHSPISFALDMIKKGQKRKSLWKFHSSLLSNKKFVCYMKNQIASTTSFLNEQKIFDDQMR